MVRLNGFRLMQDTDDITHAATLRAARRRAAQRGIGSMQLS
jgi:hypothetical protein